MMESSCNTKVLTIVIPTYNMQNYLHKCLSSLIVSDAQLPLLEVLVINDGSKDNSSAIAHEYQDKYPDTFRVIDKENGNYGSCVNRGLKEATGKYIKILDADDWFDTKNLSAFIDRLQNTDADVVLTDYNKHWKQAVEEKTNLFAKTDYIYSVKEAFEENKNGVLVVQMHSLTYKLTCFDGIDYHQTEGVSYTDKEWDLMPWMKADTMLYIPLNVYQYNLTREGQTCDLKVFFGKINDQFIGVRNCLAKAEQLHSILDSFHQDLLFEAIVCRMRELYHIVLVSMKENPKYLMEFDKDLQANYPRYAERVAEDVMRRCFPYCYVKKWRKDGYKPLPWYIHASFFFVSKSVGACKRILKIFGFKK